MPVRKWAIFLVVALTIFVVDQISKSWVIANLDLYQSQVIHPALLPVLQLTRSANTGVAFGMGSGNSVVFLALSIAIIGFLLFLLHRSEPQDMLQHIGLATVIGGAFGNVVDRIQHGHVVDFVHIVIPNLTNNGGRAWISNVSNFADHFIIIGVILLLIDTYLQDRREKTLTAQDTSSIGVDIDT